MGTFIRCPYWDSGWCYADVSLPTSAGRTSGCGGSDNCEYYNTVICTDRDPEIDDGK